MKKLKPTDPMTDRRNKNADQAVKDAFSLLFNHGFMKESEANRVDARIEKWEKDFYREVSKDT